jgi:hypothetical protein
MTEEEIIAKAAELSAKLLVPVTPLSFTVKSEQIIGFITEPKRQAKFAAIDELMRSPSGAGEMLLKACLIKEESDTRLYSDLPENDDIVISASLECLKFISAYSNEIKKN